MQSIIAKHYTQTGAVMVVPLDDLFGPEHTAFEIGKRIGYDRGHITKVMVGIADSMLGNDLTPEHAWSYCQVQLHIPKSPRQWKHHMVNAIYDAARKLAGWTPDNTFDLLYCRTTHHCVYVYARLNREVPNE
jgi:hypothetical protein